MATAAQVLANQSNAKFSTGPASAAGRELSSKNRTTHGLCYRAGLFALAKGESREEYDELVASLVKEHQPQTSTEQLLVTRMAQHEWLRARAQLLQAGTFSGSTGQIEQTQQFALYLRYEMMHERAFDKCLRELRSIRAEKRKVEIGFESQKRSQAAGHRAAESLNLKKQYF
jgi:hypothetical protein